MTQASTLSTLVAIVERIEVKVDALGNKLDRTATGLAVTTNRMDRAEEEIKVLRAQSGALSVFNSILAVFAGALALWFKK